MVKSRTLRDSAQVLESRCVVLGTKSLETEDGGIERCRYGKNPSVVMTKYDLRHLINQQLRVVPYIGMHFRLTD